MHNLYAMPTNKVITHGGQTGIELFMSAKKRSPPERIISPTNQTSSLDFKKAAVEAKVGKPEDTSIIIINLDLPKGFNAARRSAGGPKIPVIQPWSPV